MPIKHTFTSAVADSATPGIIKPSHWNSNHTADFSSETLSVSGLTAQTVVSPSISGTIITGTTINANSVISNSVSGTTVYANTLIPKDPYVDVRAYGAIGDGITDNTTAIQAAIDYCLTDPRRPKKLVFPSGKFLITDNLYIKVRENSVSTNWGIFQIEGQGGGSYSDSNVGTTIMCSAAGKAILRICEESDGSYPGGGAGVVTSPLNYLRRVDISHINFVGSYNNPTNVDGIVGRGIYQSRIYRCGFYALNYGIRFGKQGATSQETSADSIQLDYCEQNEILRNTFKYVNHHLNIMSGDVSTIQGNFFSTTSSPSGIILRLVGGQDSYDIRSNIFHPYVNGTNTALTKAIQIIGVRGYKFSYNHFEGIRGNLITGETQASEYGILENNLFAGTVASSANIFSLYLGSTNQFILKNNNIGMPQPTVPFITWSGAGGATGKQVFVDFSDNKVTTTLGGSTTYDININSAVYRSAEEGNWIPVITCTTPGDLNIEYISQYGTYKKVGRRVSASLSIATSAFTHSTASGNVSITGLPYSCGTMEIAGYGFSNEWQGITKTNYTQLGFLVIAGNNYINPRMSGSGQSVVYLAITDMPSGGAVRLIGTIDYNTDTL